MAYNVQNWGFVFIMCLEKNINDASFIVLFRIAIFKEMVFFKNYTEIGEEHKTIDWVGFLKVIAN